jgi:hypothetical protein
MMIWIIADIGIAHAGRRKISGSLRHYALAMLLNTKETV